MPRVMTMASSLHGMARKFHGKIDHNSSKFLFLLPNYVSTHTADRSCCEANCTATGLCHNFFKCNFLLRCICIFTLSKTLFSQLRKHYTFYFFVVLFYFSLPLLHLHPLAGLICKFFENECVLNDEFCVV